jgi:hypothetical protein
MEKMIPLFSPLDSLSSFHCTSGLDLCGELDAAWVQCDILGVHAEKTLRC